MLMSATEPAMPTEPEIKHSWVFSELSGRGFALLAPNLFREEKLDFFRTDSNLQRLLGLIWTLV
jgi:hypothetical protein